MRIGFIIVGTQNYLDLAVQCMDAVKKHVRIPGAEVVPFLMTNHHPKMVKVSYEYKHLPICHNPWPLLTLLRFQNFITYRQDLEQTDYLFYIDADLLVIDTIGPEILGDFTVTRHPGFYNRTNTQFTYERNPNSTCGIPYGQGEDYYIGSFNGGKTENFLKASLVMRDWLNQDLKKNYIPIFHDESALNKYCVLNKPTNVLDCRYCSPQGWEHITQTFGPAKIVALDKNHDKIRSET